MADFNAIAKQFTDFYYNTFDGDRAQLAGVYRDSSMLTWENTPMQGTAAIMEKLQGLPFAKVVHKVLTLDAQPASSTIAAIMVLVTGQLLVDDGQNVLQYSQMFHRDRDTLFRTMFSDWFTDRSVWFSVDGRVKGDYV